MQYTVTFTQIKKVRAEEAKPGKVIWRAVDLSKIKAIELVKGCDGYHFLFLTGHPDEAYVSQDFKTAKAAMLWLEMKISAWNKNYGGGHHHE